MPPFLALAQAADLTVVALKPTNLGAPDVEHLFDLAAGMRGRTLVLDFAAIDYLTSKGLAQVVALNRQLLKVRGKLVLRGLREHVRELFRVAGVERLLDIQQAAHLAP